MAKKVFIGFIVLAALGAASYWGYREYDRWEKARTATEQLSVTDGFDGKTLEELARNLSLKAYEKPGETLPAELQNLSYDEHRDIRFVRENDKYSLSFRATRMQTVKFVRACRLLGYSLLSPVQPQPEQNRFSGEADSMISYDADFVIR